MAELADDDRADLARALEEAARALSVVRYGAAFRLGLADVVLNPDNPLSTASFASGLDGDPGLVERTLLALPPVWAEAGRHQVVVLASPSSAPELQLLAEECGYEAAEETVTLLLTDVDGLVDGEPGILTRPLREADEGGIGELIAAAHDWSVGVGRRLQVVQGHRLDDPRHLAVGAYEGDRLVGVGTGFRYGSSGQVAQVAVARDARRRRYGRALVSAVATTLLQRGAETVWLTCEAGGITERFFAGLGFEPAYEAVLLTAPAT